MSAIGPQFPYTLTGPEIEAVEVFRLAHMTEFALAVTHRGGRFTIKLTDLASGQFAEGSGAIFEQAWRDLSADEMGHDLRDRIAAQGRKTSDRLQVIGGTGR